MKRLIPITAANVNLHEYSMDNDTQFELMYSKYPFLQNGHAIKYQNTDDAFYGFLYYAIPIDSEPKQIEIFAVEIYYFQDVFYNDKWSDYVVTIARKVDENGHLDNNVVYSSCKESSNYASARGKVQSIVHIEGLTLRNLKTSDFSEAMSKLYKRFPSIQQEGEE